MGGHYLPVISITPSSTRLLLQLGLEPRFHITRVPLEHRLSLKLLTSLPHQPRLCVALDQTSCKQLSGDDDGPLSLLKLTLEHLVDDAHLVWHRCMWVIGEGEGEKGEGEGFA